MKYSARLGGRSAAFVLRLLALARRRQLPLLPALGNARSGLADRRLGHALSELHAAGEEGLLDVLEGQLKRGSDPAAAGALHALRAAGLAPDGLLQLADWLANRSSSRRVRLRAVTYPIALSIFGSLGFMVLFYGLIGPGLGESFSSVYGSLGAELPLLTSFFVTLLGYGEAMLANPFTAVPYLISVFGLCIGMFVAAWRFPTGRMALWIPLASRWAYLESAQVYSSTLAMLLDSGIALPEAAGLAAKAVPHSTLSGRLDGLVEYLERGEGFAEALVDAKALPRSVGWRIWAAWYRSDLVGELHSLATDLQLQLDDQQRAIVSLTRPLAILLAGIALLPLIAMIVAMYLPLFGLMNQIV